MTRIDARALLERKLAHLEGKPIKPRGVAIAPNGVAVTEQPKKWEIKEAKKYNPDADGLAGDEAPAIEEKPAKKDKKSKKEKKLVEEVDTSMVDVDAESQPDEPIDEEEVSAIIPNGTDKKLSKEEKKAQKKAKKAQINGDSDESNVEKLAAACGLSVERYQRKLERGEISFTADGTPVAVSKKDIKM